MWDFILCYVCIIYIYIHIYIYVYTYSICIDTVYMTPIIHHTAFIVIILARKVAVGVASKMVGNRDSDNNKNGMGNDTTFT